MNPLEDIEDLVKQHGDDKAKSQLDALKYMMVVFGGTLHSIAQGNMSTHGAKEAAIKALKSRPNEASEETEKSIILP